MDNEVKILGIAGSLRKGSFNKAALRSAVSLTPSNVTLETFDISSFPLFNQDDEKTPPDVLAVNNNSTHWLIRAAGLVSRSSCKCSWFAWCAR